MENAQILQFAWFPLANARPYIEKTKTLQEKKQNAFVFLNFIKLFDETTILQVCLISSENAKLSIFFAQTPWPYLLSGGKKAAASYFCLRALFSVCFFF